MSEMNFYSLTRTDMTELEVRLRGTGPVVVGNAEFNIGMVDGVPTVIISSAGEAVAVTLDDTWNDLVSKDTNGQDYHCD